MSNRVDSLIGDYRKKVAFAVQAYHGDSLYQHLANQIRTVMVAVEIEMDQMRASEDDIDRVLRTILWAGPSEAEAVARLRGANA